MEEYNQFEYCYLVEDTDPDATTMKIYVPKLMGMIPMSNKPSRGSVSKSVLKNTDNHDVSGSVSTQGYITARVQLVYEHQHKHHNCKGNCPNTNHPNTCGSKSILKTCKHFHHDHHFPHKGEYGMIPAGAQLICCIMNNSIKDIIVTRMWCKF